MLARIALLAAAACAISTPRSMLPRKVKSVREDTLPLHSKALGARGGSHTQDVAARALGVWTAAARALKADGVYFHRQHALYSEPDRAWTFTAHDHCAVGRARTPACYCHSAALGDVVKRLREPPSTSKPPLELLNVPRDPGGLDEARRRLVAFGAALPGRRLARLRDGIESGMSTAEIGYRFGAGEGHVADDFLQQIMECMPWLLVNLRSPALAVRRSALRCLFALTPLLRGGEDRFREVLREYSHTLDEGTDEEDAELALVRAEAEIARLAR